jgi:RimJ/RimL family protein N-acetyltransferase
MQPSPIVDYTLPPLAALAALSFMISPLTFARAVVAQPTVFDIDPTTDITVATQSGASITLKQMNLFNPTHLKWYKDVLCTQSFTYMRYWQEGLSDVIGEREATLQFFWFLGNNRHYRQNFGHFILDPSGRCVGIIKAFGVQNGEAFIAYTVVEEHSGKGYTTAAVDGFVSILKSLRAEGKSNVTILRPWVYEGNERSARVLQRNGFTFYRKWGPDRTGIRVYYELHLDDDPEARSSPSSTESKNTSP